MNTFLKIALGFVLGVVCTIGVLYVVEASQNTEENQLREEIRMKALKNMNEFLDESDNIQKDLQQLSDEYDNAINNNQKLSEKLNSTRKSIQSYGITSF